MYRTSSRPNSPILSAEDEALQLSLTYLSLTTTPFQQPPPVLSHDSDQDTPASASSSAPSSTSSWVDLRRVSTSDIDRLALRRTSTGTSTFKRKKKGVRAGLTNLSNPPSPFGCQLGTPTPTLTPRISAPYQLHHQYDYFTPRPSPRELSVENKNLPQADPEEVYDTLLSALDSVKNLAVGWGKIAAHVFTDGGKKCLEGQLVKVGLVMVLCVRPRWVLGTMNWALRMLRDPWSLYHHSVYAFVIGSVLAS